MLKEVVRWLCKKCGLWWHQDDTACVCGPLREKGIRVTRFEEEGDGRTEAVHKPERG